MGRSGVSKPERCPTVPAGEFIAIEPLLHASGRDWREPRDNALPRRAIYPDAVLWDQEDAPVADRAGLRGQREASEEASAADGLGSDLRQAADLGTSARSSDLSIPFARTADRAAQPSMGDRHHLHPASARVCVSGGNHGLVQPLCSVLGGVGYAGRELLPGSAGMGIENSAAGNLQFGSGLTIHKRTIHRVAAGPRYRDQHGWTRPGDGQHLRRTPMADGKIRRGLSEGLRERPGRDRESSILFPILQSRTDTSILGLSDSGTGLLSKKGADSNRRKTGHSNDRVAVRSSIVDHYSSKYFFVEIESSG